MELTKTMNRADKIQIVNDSSPKVGEDSTPTTDDCSAPSTDNREKLDITVTGDLHRTARKIVQFEQTDRSACFSQKTKTV